MDSYLIRIYRRSADDPEKIVGMVEEIDSGRTHVFKNLAGLCKILEIEVKSAPGPLWGGRRRRVR